MPSSLASFQNPAARINWPQSMEAVGRKGTTQVRIVCGWVLLGFLVCFCSGFPEQSSYSVNAIYLHLEATVFKVFIS